MASISFLERVQALPEDVMMYIYEKVEVEYRKLALQLSLKCTTTDLASECEKWTAIQTLVPCNPYFTRRACRVRDMLYQFAEAEGMFYESWDDQFDELQAVLLRFMKAPYSFRLLP